ncbi:MAG: hypothetical protein K8F91_09785 [Candidatus Obscuribacterales bacterium]|nr:hypothetical protein [Candidatus Obscuribacterales bacterium]
MVYYEQGNYKDAETMVSRAINIREEKANLKQAETKYKQALIISENLWGPDNPRTLPAIENNGRGYSAGPRKSCHTVGSRRKGH